MQSAWSWLLLGQILAQIQNESSMSATDEFLRCIFQRKTFYFVENKHLQLHYELAQLLPSYRNVRIPAIMYPVKISKQGDISIQ